MRFLLSALLAALMLCAVVPASPASSASADPVAPAQLDRGAVDSYVEGYLDRHGLAGAQVAVVRDGTVLHTAGYGQSHGAATTTETPMATGSVGKSMTSFALLQLVEAGVVALDDPVIEHLPQFELADERSSDITIRHLLSHTSGLPSPVVVGPAADLGEGVERLQDWQLEADPGEQYLYSNMNYQVAGRLIETVAQVPLATYLEENLFQPLGMEDTRSVATAGADDPGLQDGHVTAYGTTVGLREMEQLLAGSGGVISTAEDHARWLAMLTADGATPSRQQLLSPELLAEAMSPQPGAEGDGLGWSLRGEEVDPARVGHSGATSRYSAQLDIVPSSGYGVVVMLSSFTPTLEHPYEISSGIIDLTEGGSPQLGVPVPTLLDAALGLLTLLVLALTALGVRRAGGWARRRAAWPLWRFGLRLLLHAISPVLAVAVFLVLPSLEVTITPLDVLGVWPAAMVLLLALAVSGVVLIVARGAPWMAQHSADEVEPDATAVDTAVHAGR